MRDTLKDAAYFENRIGAWQEYVAHTEKDLKAEASPIVKPQAAYLGVFSSSYKAFIARYSCGEAVGALRKDFPALIQLWERYLAHPAHEPFAFDAPITEDVRYVSNYALALWMLSWAYLFDLDEAMWLRLVACVGNAGKDLLVERLILHRLPWLAAERPPARQLVYPKAYQPLYDALDAPPAQQAKLLTSFLQGWYKHMKKAYWYNAHKEGGYFGYWAWEAAGVTAAFGLDDSTYRDLPYYPQDAVAFTRTR